MTSKATAVSVHRKNPIRIRPVTSYFVLTFAISWAGALILTAPRFIRGVGVPKLTGLMIFPIMLLGPGIAGIVMTRIVGGRRGLRDLYFRMRRVRIPAGWYAVLLIPPILIFSILHLFKAVVSRTFAPNFFLFGLCFGLIAGFVEEVGWTGYVFPAMARKQNAFPAAVGLGFLWGAWHIPAVDYLGTATPHGSFWIPYFLVFTAAMMAIRVLIAWLYANTGSVLLAQLMHASSTGSLVVFSPPGVTAGQETLWYGAYALVLWILVAVVVGIYGSDLKRHRASRT
jgi:membrane protease YdiL (CAAX protease family)